MDKDYSLVLTTAVGTETHLHKGLECILLLQGHLELEIGPDAFCMREDDLVVINRNQLHTVRGNHNNLVLTLSIGESRLQQECGSLAECRLHCNGATQDMKGDGTYFEMKRIMVNMFNIKLNKPHAYALNLNMNLLRFLHLLFTAYARREADGTGAYACASKPDHQAILEFVQQNCRRPLSLKETASHFYLSPAYFSKYFKKLAGMGFLQYLQQVRVDSSLPQLLHTGDSILQIAMDHGFANAKAYSDSFVRRYGEAPGAYRKHHHVEGAQGQAFGKARVLLEDDPAGTANLEFLRYVKRYEVEKGRSQAPVDENHVILATQAPSRHLRPMENLLLIDEPAMALHKDFELCLEGKEHTGARYAYFQLLNYHMDPQEFGAFTFHQVLECVSTIHRYGLYPFIRLDFCRHPYNGSDEELDRYLQEWLYPMLLRLSQNFHGSETRHWRFEIVCDCFSPRQAILFYKGVWMMLHELFSAPQSGLFAVHNGDGSIGSAFDGLLAFSKQQGMEPAFVTFHGFQNRLKRQSPPDTEFYNACAGFHADLASSILVACRKHGISAPLYMTAWNTLSGETQSEINVYIRGGLILETLMELYNTVQGVGYRHAKRNTCPYSGERYAAPLNLYIFNNTKRPVYYVANIAKRMSGMLLYQADHVGAVRNHEGELVVTVWNPQYLNPAVSADTLLTDSLTRQIRVELNGLEDRPYHIKRFTVDASSSGSLTHLQRSGYPDWSDRDAYEYLRNTAGGDLFYFTQQPSEGTLVLRAPVHYNGIVMYTLK